MHESRGIISSQHGRVEALQAKRLALKDKIKEARNNPERLRRLKQENLLLKDEIEQEMQQQ